MNATDYRREGAIVNLSIRTKQLDAVVAKEVKDGLASFPLDTGVSRIVVDLNDVDFVDSSGVGALLSLHRRASPGVLIHLLRVKPEVRTVLELLRLHRIFVITL